MEIITPSTSLKNIMKNLPTQTTAQVGQKFMLYDDNNNPVGKMQAPTDSQGTALVFEPNAHATATTEPSATASAATMGKLYMVGPQTGTKYQWITLEDDSTTPSTYFWLNIGSTQIDLLTYEAPEQDIRNIVRNWTPST